jgi:hypothetical protein
MADYSETPQEVERKTVRETNAGRERIIRSDYDRVVREPHGVSGGTVAAIVIAAIACAVLITLLIMNNQQQQRDADRERTEEQAQSSQPQQQPQQPAQQPPIVVVPGAQPAPAPLPAPAQPSTADKGIPSSAALEASVTSKLLEDSMLGTYPVDVKAENGVVTLSGDLPTQALKQRATTVAKSVTGVSGVINNIRVKSQ